MSIDEDRTAIWIRGTGDYAEAAGDAPPPLKEVVKQALGTPVRRIGRFIQLALIGAGRCVGERRPAADTGVYMASARGDFETTTEVMHSLFRHGLSPMPLQFVNTVSNAACYYVARQFGLAGRSIFICNRSLALESVLELAELDMTAGHLDAALVGSVDAASAPLAEHRQRVGLPAGARVAEGSHWLWLQQGERPPDACGQLLAARGFADCVELLDWWYDTAFEMTDCRLAPGPCLNAADLEAIRASIGVTTSFESPSLPGFYDSQSGATLSAFLRGGAGTHLLSVNGEAEGSRCHAVLLRREAS